MEAPFPDPWLDPLPRPPDPAGSAQEPMGGELESLFRHFDADGDGWISRSEVDRSLASLAGVLSDGDGEDLRRLLADAPGLSKEAFLRWARSCSCFDELTCLREIFDLIDADGSGSLCSDELAVLLQVIDPAWPPEQIQSLLQQHDLNADGSLGFDEFLHLLRHGHGLELSLGVLRRLKKTLTQYLSGTRSGRIGLVEVDCDLGAGVPGAGSGIDLLQRAARRQLDLHLLRQSLIEEIAAGVFSPRARASEVQAVVLDRHARHIETIAGVMAEAAELVATTRRRGLMPVVLAGDHSTAAGTIAGLRRAHPHSRLGVVWIDAHADIHSPYTSPTGNLHGMPLAVATGHDNHHHAVNVPDPRTLELWETCKALAGDLSPPLDLRDLIYIGVRDTEPAEEATIRAHGLPIVSTEEVRRSGPEAAAARCLHYLRDCDLLYVSFDVDSIDATICKGTGTPVPGGLLLQEAVEIHRALMADPRVVCWEICEINPELDTLNSVAEISLGVFRAVLEVLEERL